MFFRFQWEIPPEFQRRKCGLSTYVAPTCTVLWNGILFLFQRLTITMVSSTKKNRSRWEISWVSTHFRVKTIQSKLTRSKVYKHSKDSKILWWSINITIVILMGWWSIIWISKLPQQSSKIKVITVVIKRERHKMSIWTSFVKIWIVCSCKFKTNFLFFGVTPVAFWSRNYLG
jgi:hypothetical protein